MEIGRIVASTAHNNYICRVNPEWEQLSLDTEEFIALGDFIRITHPSLGRVIGFVHDTQVTSLGSMVYVDHSTPYFLHHTPDEKGSVTFIKILIIGHINTQGKVIQGIPLCIIPNASTVEFLSDDEIRLFHLRQGNIHMSYLPYLKLLDPPLLFNLLKQVNYHP